MATALPSGFPIEDKEVNHPGCGDSVAARHFS